ncbi:cellulase_1 [Hexamita inflata]|uniref:Cellulase 1 n=1 Tax=Hexamita inflata TaxID=28002 RepID=A0AA86PN06_9EUKA|nr:cellulase 1 [Hexamita inflata]
MLMLNFFTSLQLELFSRNSRIEDIYGNKVSLKGYSFFGFETSVAVVHGLWSQNLEFLLDWTKSQGYNAIRVPFACDFALNLDGKRPLNSDGSSAINYNQNPKLVGLTSGQVLDYFVNAAAARGLVIVFVMHHLYGTGGIDPLWYDNSTSEAQVLQGWTNMIKRYNQWNVIGADIKNEPHDTITWGTGNILTDFDTFCQRAGNTIHQINPRLLIFVEGVHKWGNSWSCWGESLQGVLQYPVKLNVQNKVVYSPHVYGQAVSGMPNNDIQNWSDRFGFIVSKKLGPAIMIGEWGGDVVDYPFLTNFATWMSQNGITDHFHWSLNPNSADTKGLLGDDWKTPVQAKLNIINSIQMTPTVFPSVPACPSSSPYMNSGSCTASCSSGYYSIVSGVLTCSQACSVYFVNTTNGNQKQCVTSCPSSAPFNDGGSCLAQCPTQSPYSDNNNCVVSCLNHEVQNISGVLTCVKKQQKSSQVAMIAGIAAAAVVIVILIVSVIICKKAKRAKAPKAKKVYKKKIISLAANQLQYV